MSARWLGAVLAGGASTRFGSDKADARVGERTMLEHALGIATEAVDRVVVVGRELPGGHVVALPDRRPGAGPMAGLEVALEHAASTGLDGVLLIGCDLPLLTAEDLRAVCESWSEGDTVVAPSRGGAPGAIEPLCALYATGLHHRVAELLDDGVRSLHALFDVGGGRAVSLPDAVARGAFTNVNTPADHQRAVERLEARREVGT